MFKEKMSESVSVYAKSFWVISPGYVNMDYTT